MKELREHERMSPDDNVFVALGSCYTKVGRMKDISKGGLSFEYLLYETDMYDTEQKCDIFSTKNTFSLTGVPCQIVYDIASNGHTSHSFALSISNMRCGIRFTSLTDHHKTTLDSLLDSQTPPAMPES